MRENEEIVEEEEDQGNRSILLDLVAQLTGGTEISKITLPTFVLEPRSMCERLSDFFAYQDYLIKAIAIENEKERIIQIARWIFSGHHKRPKGVKKPFNPILGEFFRIECIEVDNSHGFYICEQISHHPPESVYFYANPERSLYITGELRPKVKFFGNSTVTMMEGGSTIYLGFDHSYSLTNPNVYARSLLIGRMYMELGDHCKLKSMEGNLECNIEFKTKGMFGNQSKDCVLGSVKNEKNSIYTISGKWSGKTVYNNDKTGDKMLFDQPEVREHLKLTKPIADLEEFESSRLWEHLALAISKSDHKTATIEKTRIETRQRGNCTIREAEGKAWEPRFFKKGRQGQWVPNLMEIILKDRANKVFTDVEVVRNFIFSPPTKDIHMKFWI